jgi:hypothetical protein
LAGWATAEHDRRAKATASSVADATNLAWTLLRRRGSGLRVIAIL